MNGTTANDATTFIIVSAAVSNTATLSKSSSSTSNAGVITNYLPIIDASTGKAKLHYKVDENKEVSAMTSLENGDVLLCALKNKNTFVSYVWGKETFHSRFASPEPLCALTSNQFHVIGGSLTGELYVWEIGSGFLLKAWKAHYRPITKIAFCADGVGFLTCGEDGNILKWNLSSALDVLKRDYSPKSDASFNLHKLPVTGLEMTLNSFFAVTSSLDRTCKVFELKSKKEVNSFVYPTGLTCLTICGNSVLCGSTSGIIYLQEDAFYHGEHANKSFQLHGHEMSVTCVTQNGSDVLFSSSLDSTIRVWNLQSKQAIKTIPLSTPIRAIVVINRANDFHSARSNSSSSWHTDLRKHIVSPQEEVLRRVVISRKRFYLCEGEEARNSNDATKAQTHAEPDTHTLHLKKQKEKMKAMVEKL